MQKFLKLLFCLLNLKYVRSNKIDRWNPVSVYESEISDPDSNLTIGTSKSELVCAMEATKLIKDMFCFRNDQCQLLNLVKIAYGNDSQLLNDPTVVACKSKLNDGCIVDGKLYKVEEEMKLSTGFCLRCKPKGLLEDLITSPIPR